MRFTINPITDEFDVVGLGSGTFTETITGNSGGAVGPDGTGNINLLGDNTSGINIVGSPGTSTLTVFGLPSSTTQIGTTRYATNAEAANQLLTSAALTPSNITSMFNINPLPASQGGTGLSSPAANSLLITNGSSPFTVLGVASNGQIPIGSIGSAPVLANITSSGGTITVTNGPGTINLDLAGGSVGIDSISPDSGTDPVVPTGAGLVNMKGSGSITTVGSLNTITTQLTGLTNHAVLVGAGTTTITKVGPTATAGQVLQSAGAAADPVFSTATYPATTTINQVLYSSAANVVGGITAANNGTMISGTTGIPSWLANGTTGQILTATTGSPPSWASPATGGDVVGPGSATDNALVRFDGTTGKLIQNGVITEDDTGNLSVTASVSGATLSTTVSNTSNTASSNAANFITVAGTSANDAFVQYAVSGTTTWTEGIDNSASDAYVIAASTDLGTTNVMSVSTAGEINWPLQPAFLAYLPSTVLNVTGNATDFQLGTTTALTEVFDQNSDFNTNGTFTAPVTGRYSLQTSVVLGGCTIGTLLNLTFVTSNRTYNFQTARAAGSQNLSQSGSVLADMDAADTAVTVVQGQGEAGDTQDLFGGASPIFSFFSGMLSA